MTTPESYEGEKGAVCLLFPSILGSGLEKRSYLMCRDPHVNVCEVKTLSGDFDLFAFTGVGVKGGLLWKAREPGV